MGQIFLSYSSADAPWCERLASELQRHRLDVFMDSTSLRAGGGWEQQVLQALEESQFFIVLWSANASKSDWVVRERAYFDVLMHEGGKNPRQTQAGTLRRLIVLPLDDTPVAFTSLQMIPTIKESRAYTDGVSALSKGHWETVVSRVEDAVTDADYVPLSVAVITITQDRLDRIDFTRQPELPDQMDLATLLSHLGISRDKLTKYYGATRREWTPFGPDSQSIENILESVRFDLNSRSTGLKFRWDWLDDELWGTDAETIRSAAQRLSSEHSVIVIDPLALYEPRVKDLMIQYLDDWLNNERAIIMVLSIYPTWEPQRYLKRMISQINNQIVSRYYGDPPRRMPFATCNVFTGDELDIKRLLRTNLRVQTGIGRSRARNPFLRNR